MFGAHFHPIPEVLGLGPLMDPLVGRESVVPNADGTWQKVERYRDAGLTLACVYTATRDAQKRILRVQLDVYDDAGGAVVQTAFYTITRLGNGAFSRVDVS